MSELLEHTSLIMWLVGLIFVAGVTLATLRVGFRTLSRKFDEYRLFVDEVLKRQDVRTQALMDKNSGLAERLAKVEAKSETQDQRLEEVWSTTKSIYALMLERRGN